MIDLGFALRDGAVLAVAGAALLVGVLRYNSRLFMRHFPDALKARLAPLSPQEMRSGRVVGVALLAVLVAGPVASTWMAAAREPGASFLQLFAHALVVGMVFNLVDWLLIDELLIGALKPGWALPPGATQADFLPFEHGRHARGFVVGTGLCAVVALIAAGIASLA